MIKIIKNNNVIEISGHAGYDTYGKDIVCSSVSSICYTTINALKKLDKFIEVVDKDKMIIKFDSSDETSIKLIDNMLDLLKDLSNDYPKNIIVKEN